MDLFRNRPRSYLEVTLVTNRNGVQKVMPSPKRCRRLALRMAKPCRSPWSRTGSQRQVGEEPVVGREGLRDWAGSYRGGAPFSSPRCSCRILAGKGFTGRTGDTLLKTQEVRSRILKANGLFWAVPGRRALAGAARDSRFSKLLCDKRAKLSAKQMGEISGPCDEMPETGC